MGVVDGKVAGRRYHVREYVSVPAIFSSLFTLKILTYPNMNLPSCINQNWLTSAPKAYTYCPPVTIEEKIIVPHLIPKTLQENETLLQ